MGESSVVDLCLCVHLQPLTNVLKEPTTVNSSVSILVAPSCVGVTLVSPWLPMGATALVSVHTNVKCITLGPLSNGRCRYFPCLFIIYIRRELSPSIKRVLSPLS